MDITNKILKFFMNRKQTNNEPTSLISLDRFLVNVEKEKEYLGQVLTNQIKELERENLISSNNKNQYYITEKGIVYLNENSGE